VEQAGRLPHISKKIILDKSKISHQANRLYSSLFLEITFWTALSNSGSGWSIKSSIEAVTN